MVWVVWGDMKDDSAEILFQFFFFQEVVVNCSCMGRDVTLWQVYSAFPLPTTASTTLQAVLKDGFGDTFMTLDMPEPCKYLSLDSCQKRLLWPITRQLILFHIKSLVLCSKEEMQRSFLGHLVSKSWSLFSDCKSQLQTSRTLHGVTNSGNVLKV